MANSTSESSLAQLAELTNLFEKHQQRLLEILQRRIDPKLERRISPEGVLSETYIKARQKWSAFKSKGTMAEFPWLYRLAYDCLFEAWEKNKRQCRDYKLDVPWPEQSSVQLGLRLVAEGAGPATEAAKEDMRQRMRDVLAMLPEKDREILWMRHNDDLKIKEIAEAFEIKENAASLRYLRALEKLKQLWQRLYHDEV